MPEGAGFCHRCGAQLPQGATFCPKCGAAVASAATPQATTVQPSTTRRGEKSEKHEKREKDEKGEKGGGGGGMLGALVGGLILIWLGITFYLEQNGYLASDIWWAYFIAGVGAILVVQGVVVYSRGHVGLGPLVGGAVLVFIGLTSIASRSFRLEAQLWPLLLVALGIIVVFAGVASRRRVPTP